MCLPFRKKKQQGNFGYQLLTEMQIHLTRNILLFANFILKQKISKQITLHVLALLGYECVWNPKLYILFLWNLLTPFLGGKGLTDL